jgi:hypothetical protein
VHLVEDGLASGLPDRVKAMERSRRLLELAASLRPEDSRLPIMLRSGDYNLAILHGTDPSTLADAVVAAADSDWFGLFAALALFRDPTANPMSAPYIDRLLHIACRDDRLGCDKPPAPDAAPPTPDGTLTRSVVGPVWVSDLLVRRAEFLLKNGPNEEVPARLGAAKGLLAYA